MRKLFRKALLVIPTILLLFATAGVADAAPPVNTWEKVFFYHSGLGMKLAGYSFADGTRIRQQACTPGGAQIETACQWMLVPVGGHPGYNWIKNRYSGKCITVSGASLLNGAVLFQWGCASAGHQWWKLDPVAGNYYQIRNYNSFKCINVPGASLGTVDLIQWSCQWGAAPYNDVTGWAAA